MAEWRMKGEWNESCYAPPLCPAYFGSPFCEEFCQGILVFDISEGSYEGTDIGGTKHCVAFNLPAKLITDAFGKSPAMLYIDEIVSDEQAEALEAINREIWEGTYGPIQGVKRVPIAYEKELIDGGPGVKRFLVDIPDILHFEAESLLDSDGNPTKLVGSPLFGGTVYVGKAAKTTYEDPDATFKWEIQDSSASFFEFDIGPGELWHPIE
jgi:hypothetical protein